MDDPITINSLEDLLREVNELLQKHEQHERRIWFRGQPDSRWALVPLIQRNSLHESETYITNDFYIKSKQVLKNPPAKENYAAWMSLMQHYGLPTRLLDWSLSPLIAAFFATEKYTDLKYTSAAIWVLFPRMLNTQEGFGNFVFPNDAYSVQQMLVRAFKEKHVIAPEYEDKIMACCSTENDLRMYSQQSAFTAHNSVKQLVNMSTNQMLYKLIIPDERRGYFLDSLDSFGINQSFIYPDMEHIAGDIKRRYPSKNRFDKCRNYEELLREAIRELAQITQTGYDQIFLLATTEPHSIGLVVFAKHILCKKNDYKRAIVSGAIFDSLRKDAIVNIKDVKKSKDKNKSDVYFPANNETKSELVVPISTVGVFNSESENPDHFSDDMVVQITSLLNDFSKTLYQFGYKIYVDQKDIPCVTYPE